MAKTQQEGTIITQYSGGISPKKHVFGFMCTQQHTTLRRQNKTERFRPAYVITCRALKQQQLELVRTDVEADTTHTRPLSFNSSKNHLESTNFGISLHWSNHTCYKKIKTNARLLIRATTGTPLRDQALPYFLLQYKLQTRGRGLLGEGDRGFDSLFSSSGTLTIRHRTSHEYRVL